MTHHRIDAIARMAGGSRRQALGLALAALVGFRPPGDPAAASAMCRANRQRCAHGDQCCSGVCAGKPRKRRCRRSFSQSTCTIELDSCPMGETSPVTGCGVDCFCWVTAAGASLCGQLIDNAATCDDCAQVAPGTVCVRGGTGECPEAFACVKPCPRRQPN